MTPAYESYTETTYPSNNSRKYVDGWRRVKGSGHGVKPTDYLIIRDDYEKEEGNPLTPGGVAQIYRNDIWSNEGNTTRIKAYDKLRSQLNRAELGTGIAEAGATIQGINSRCVQLVRGFAALKRGDVKKFSNTFRKPTPPKLRKLPPWKVRRDASGIWLEYWLMWAPTVGDVYNALEVATGDSPAYTIRGSSSYSKHYADEGGDISWLGYANTFDAMIRVGYKANVTISNPNIALLNQFGLVNPMKVFYDLMFLSFVVEWFVNLGQVLSAFTDFAGFDVEAESNLLVKAKGQCHSVTNGNVDYKGVDSSVMFTRALGLVTPELGVRRVRGLSTTRGATAIALLVSMLAPTKRR